MVRTIPVAIVHTMARASDALSCSIVKVSRAKGITIEPSADAFGVCALREGQSLGINPFVQTVRGVFVQQIEPAKDAMLTEEVGKLYSWAFERVCGFKVVGELVVEGLTVG